MASTRQPAIVGDPLQRLRARAVVREKGRFYEDFTIGQVLEHHWGRTLTAADNVLFSSLTLNYNPLYLNAEFAIERGHPTQQINPYLVLLVVFGMSVEDLSEKGGAFLGIEHLTFHRPVYPDATVYARSEVTAKRPSRTRPDEGIVTWQTEGRLSSGDVILNFSRTNLITRKKVAAE